MAATLQEILLAPDTRPKVIADCYTLIEQEVSDKSGISGTAVKLAYKTVNAFLPGHIRHMVESLLPQIADKLQPYWADFSTSGGSEFGDYLAKRGEEVLGGSALGDRRPRGSLRPTHDHQGVRHRPRQRRQARRDRAPARRRPGIEVRALTASAPGRNEGSEHANVTTRTEHGCTGFPPRRYGRRRGWIACHADRSPAPGEIEIVSGGIEPAGSRLRRTPI